MEVGSAEPPTGGWERGARLLRRVRRAQDRFRSFQILVDESAQLTSPLHLGVQIAQNLLSLPALVAELLLQLLDTLTDLSELLGVALQLLKVVQAELRRRALWCSGWLAGATGMQ